MVGRRSLTLVLTAAAALAAPIATASGEQPPGVLEVRLGEATCHDLSPLTTAFPWLRPFFPGDLSASPLVRYEIRRVVDGFAPFEVTVDGERRAVGTVGRGGLVSAQAPLSNEKATEVVVTSGEQVLVNRTYHATC
ncbi:hypothetical protein AB0I53_00870 [Saccharopolyspora sp. NPDC050389]|uniref:hypothetical protein n=1 Tax=Saccharopolyspora sp. NPDC050389 TaxID=3155516 RepID=UPI0033F20526